MVTVMQNGTAYTVTKAYNLGNEYCLGGGEKAYKVDLLVVGGGGGGGSKYMGGGGGGGSGGIVNYSSYPLTGTTYCVVIGSGGSKGYYNSSSGSGYQGYKGGDTCIYSSQAGQCIVAYGGGGGNSSYSCACSCSYATGGGGVDCGAGLSPCLIPGNLIQGLAGSNIRGGGYCGNGCGFTSSITGTSVIYGGGGGNGGCRGGGVCQCGCGQGGNAGYNAKGVGGGGGGATDDAQSGGAALWTGGNGCAGIAIIRYHTDGSDNIKCATGGTKTTSGDYTIHTFTSSGTFCIVC